MTSAKLSHDALVDLLARTFKDDGFQFYIDPAPSMLPKFLGTYRPDAIAVGKDRNVAIEVKQEGSGSQSGDRLKEAATLFEGQKNWEFRVYYYPKPESPPRIEPSATQNIQEALLGARIVQKAGHFAPALVLNWAALEAIARRLLPERFPSPTLPRNVVEILAAEAFVDPEDAKFLRSTVPLRNSYVHGNLATEVSVETVERMNSILAKLLTSYILSPSTGG